MVTILLPSVIICWNFVSEYKFKKNWKNVTKNSNFSHKSFDKLFLKLEKEQYQKQQSAKVLFQTAHCF